MSDLDRFRDGLQHDMHRAAFDYWVSKMKNGHLPGRQNIDPVEIPSLLSNTVLIDVHHDDAGSTHRYKYRLAGSAIAEVLGIELTGQWLHEFYDQATASEIREIFEHVVNNSEPYVNRREKAASSSKDHICYDVLVLPLASDGQTVDMLFQIVYFLPSEMKAVNYR